MGLTITKTTKHGVKLPQEVVKGICCTAMGVLFLCRVLSDLGTFTVGPL